MLSYVSETMFGNSVLHSLTEHLQCVRLYNIGVTVKVLGRQQSIFFLLLWFLRPVGGLDKKTVEDKALGCLEGCAGGQGARLELEGHVLLQEPYKEEGELEQVGREQGHEPGGHPGPDTFARTGEFPPQRSGVP